VSVQKAISLSAAEPLVALVEALNGVESIPREPGAAKLKLVRALAAVSLPHTPSVEHE
jgi:hypothetical protein